MLLLSTLLLLPLCNIEPWDKDQEVRQFAQDNIDCSLHRNFFMKPGQYGFNNLKLRDNTKHYFTRVIR